MGHVAPPDEDIGVVDHVLGQAVLRLVEGCGAHLESARLLEALGDRAVDADRVDLADVLVLLLVPELVPDGDANCVAQVLCPFIGAS